MLAPRSVAIIGASSDPDKIGGRPIKYMKQFGYAGEIYPINPSRETVQDLPAYPSLAALPAVPDAVVIAVAGDRTVEAVAECAACGVKAVVVMASGFGEVPDPKGKAQQREMVDTARAAGMRMIGPNSQGVANFGNGAILNFSTLFTEQQPLDGGIAIISQSGAMSSVPYGLLRSRGLGIRHVHATGNDADINVGELSEAVVHDPDVKLLLLYLENLADPDSLARAATTAKQRGVPIVAIMGGRSADGQRAAKSHTGAIANEDAVVNTYFKKLGIWRVRSMREMVDTADLYLKGWVPDGRNLVVMSNSGALCVLTADAATDRGMPLTTFDPDIEAELREILPGFATSTNPVDVTAALLSDSGLFGRSLPVIARDKSADIFILAVPVAGKGYDVPRFARDAAAVSAQTGKPVVIVAPQESVAAEFKKKDLVVFGDEATAVDSLDRYASHHELIARSRPESFTSPLLDPTSAATAKSKNLSEADSLIRLAESGVPTIPFRLCHNESDVRAAIESLGTPVAVKGCSADVPHKSELGLVALDLQTPDEAVAAYEQQRDRMKSAGIAYDGVLVAAMAGRGHEVMVGAHRDKTFGPVVVFGAGGKYVEALDDAALLLPPFSRGDVLIAIADLRITSILAGLRGEAPADLDAWTDAVCAVGDLMVANHDIQSLDVNPLILNERGIVAVDAAVFVS